MSFECPECGDNLSRMYSKEYLDEKYPVNSAKDFSNMQMQIEAKRQFKCDNCGYVKRLSDTEYFKYIMSHVRKKK